MLLTLHVDAKVDLFINATRFKTIGAYDFDCHFCQFVEAKLAAYPL